MRRWAIAIILGGELLGSACGPPKTHSVVPSAQRERETNEIENLVAFARMYGYVRYFHPTEAAEAAPWQWLAAVGVEHVRHARNLDQLAKRLQQVYEPLAPTSQLWVTPEPAPAVPPLPKTRKEVFWQYEGYEGTPLSVFNPPYSKARVTPEARFRRRYHEEPAPSTRVDTELVPDLHLRMPVVLSPEQAQATVEDKLLAQAVDIDIDDLSVSAVRLGAVIEVWNVLRHFYPYQGEIEIEWDAVLRRALREAGDSSGRAQFQAAMRHMVHALEDGHGKVGFRRSPARASLPFRLELIEGQAVVTATDAPKQFRVGDVVRTIDGVDIVAHIQEVSGTLSGSPQWRNFRAAAWEVPRGVHDTQAAVRVARGPQDVTIHTRYARRAPPLPPRPQELHTFEDGVAYVDLTRASWPTIKAALPALAAAPGLIFDMRGYPVHNDAVINHLLTEPEQARWMHVPRILEPDGKVISWREIGWDRTPSQPRISGAVVFLTSAGAISYAESILSYAREHDLGTLIGQRTAGANGDIVRIDTLGGLFVIFSGMRVTTHGGEPFHGSGMQPDITVKRTIKGLAAGQDEALDRGLAHIRAEIQVRQQAAEVSADSAPAGTHPGSG